MVEAALPVARYLLRDPASVRHRALATVAVAAVPAAAGARQVVVHLRIQRSFCGRLLQVIR